MNRIVTMHGDVQKVHFIDCLSRHYRTFSVLLLCCYVVLNMPFLTTGKEIYLHLSFTTTVSEFFTKISSNVICGITPSATRT